MTIEATLLLSLVAFLLLGALIKPSSTFKEFAPMLGARVENQLAVGSQFRSRNGSVTWQRPRSPIPEGKFK